MKLRLLHFFIFSWIFSQAQNPLVKIWDKRFGGLHREEFYAIKSTMDGGYILGGLSTSGIGGDKSEACWDTSMIPDPDYWVVKVDSAGNLEWEKTFGGIDWDQFTDLATTFDGGYILGGWSNSDSSGNKTQPNHGLYDYWVVKLDSLGNKQWDATFGGTLADYLFAVLQTRDGGYILGGASFSDSSIDKSQNSWGYSDYWIIKLDSAGNKLWDKDYGAVRYDDLRDIYQSSDGGYVMGGSSDSDIGGDKTQNHKGFDDYWILKIDSSGVVQWDKTLGGANEDWFSSVEQTTDNGYIIGGFSYSGISGDKTQNSCGSYDYWIIKLDSLGNTLWDKDFGSFNSEEMTEINQTTDGGYLISGDSYSQIGGNKSENNMGVEQTWILKIDSAGNSIWDKTIFTQGHDETGTVIQTRDGCYTIANSTASDIGGYKSQSAWSIQPDYWIIKFCDSTVLQALFVAPTQICPGSCIDFLNMSFQATGYQWTFEGSSPDTSTAVNPIDICYSTPGQYSVTLIASNANNSDTILLPDYITVFPFPPPISITQIDDTLYATSGATTYQWYFNGSLINGASNDYFVINNSGDYNVISTDANGCEAEAAIYNVIATTGKSIPLDYINVHPNPTHGILNIEAIDGIRMFKIYNYLGECVYYSITEKKIIDIINQPKGLYLLEITFQELNKKRVYKINKD